MIEQTLSQRAANHAIQRNILAGAVVLSLFTSAVLSYKVLVQDVEVRLVPGLGGDEMAISRTSVSQNYLQLVTRDIVMAWSTTTSRSEKHVRSVLLDYACPEYQGSVSQQIYDRWDEIRRKKLTTVFFPSKMKTNTDELVASSRGLLESWVGKNRTSAEKVEFRIEYRLDGGRICFSKFVGVEK